MVGDSDKFMKISDSLRQYRRSELKDFEDDLGEKPIDQLYVDALPDEAILKSILSNNTTFLLGRKGTGKSTVFARAQSEIKKQKKELSIYLDVKSLYDLVSVREIINISENNKNIDSGIIHSHLLRKAFLARISAEIIKSIAIECEEMSIWDKWLGRKKTFEELKNDLSEIHHQLSQAKLEDSEIPVLRTITKSWKHSVQGEEETERRMSLDANVDPISARISGSASIKDFEKSLDDKELYENYSEVVLRSFPFERIISKINSLLEESDLKRLVVFFDDFSELTFLDQKLFVDIILSPLNNSSREMVKLKIAGYPGRVYYGRIDSTKVDTLSLDFAALYEATEVQSMESSAVEYTKRLLTTRFSSFSVDIEDYFDTSSGMDAHYRQIFQATFNVPRLMGALLHTCYLDAISKGRKISISTLRLSARKYYENTIAQYFDRLNRFALEPFENKLDRHNQKLLLNMIIDKMRETRRRILAKEVGGTYFAELSNPPTSHFVVSSKLSNVFDSLEANFLLSRYKDTRDKNGKAVTVYAFFQGITEMERVTWGYPEGRKYRNYFVQRCFDYTVDTHQFLAKKQTIRCDHCAKSFPMELKDSIALYKWTCPECQEGTCSVVNLSDDFEAEVKQAQEDIQLEPVELLILETLHAEGAEMAAGDISSMIDTTYQLVGRRTSKLQESGLIDKERDEKDRRMKSSITQMAEEIYFNEQ